ncbi:hypothetical protein J6590_050345 [Homalodisca vitripennis]|nr:hypothetical protein J6590_050345 [Homalodisca vitripennis]
MINFTYKTATTGRGLTSGTGPRLLPLLGSCIDLQLHLKHDKCTCNAEENQAIPSALIPRAFCQIVGRQRQNGQATFTGVRGAFLGLSRPPPASDSCAPVLPLVQCYTAEILPWLAIVYSIIH